MPNLLIPNLASKLIKNKTITIANNDAFHLIKVLRIKIQEKIFLLDGEGKKYLAQIKEIKKNQLTVEVLNLIEESSQNIKIFLACGLSQKKRLDFIVEKSTELGVYSIIPIYLENTNIKKNIDLKKALLRWQKIAKNACEQSGNLFLPKINEPLTLVNLINKFSYLNFKLVFYEKTTFSLKNFFRNLIPNTLQEILVLIGAEGGFSEKEINLLKEQKFQVFSLGKNILRTETAPLVVLSIFNYELLN